MKIFYITSVLGDWGGSEIYARDLLKELQKRGHELCIATTEKYDLPDAKMVHLPAFGHHAFFKFEALLSIGKVLKAAKEFQPDIVQSHSNSLMGLLGHLVKWKLRIPHVLLIELISSENKNLHTKTIFAMEKFLLPKLNYDKLVVWTENMKQKFLLPWNIKSEKILVQPAALNLENYPLETSGMEINEKYGKHLICCVKTLWSSNAKGLEYIIKAMKFVSQKHPEYKLVIFGKGPCLESLRELVKTEDLQKFVELPGGIPPNDAKKVWAATEISPHSFVYEFSTSISLLEFMAMGKPCIATDIGSVKDFVKDSALVVKAVDEKAISDGIIKLIEDETLRIELGKKARKLVEEKYSIKATVDALEKIYQSILT